MSTFLYEVLLRKIIQRVIFGWLVGQFLSSTIRHGLFKRQFDWLEHEFQLMASWLHLQPALA